MKISIVEDEKILASKIELKLKRNGFSVEVFNDIKTFKNNFLFPADLYILDISLGDGSGLDLIKWIREEKNISSPIIITSGHSDEQKKIYGLNIGADDYITKPYSPSELIARIKAVIRRSYDIMPNSIINYKDIVYNIAEKEVLISGKKIILTSRELQLIELMLYNKGKLVTKTRLINSVWGEHDINLVSDNTINVTLSRVRKKLGKSFELITLINKGYILK